MKTFSRSSLVLAASLMLLACGDGKDEETIRITIDKGGQKVTAESGVRPTPTPRKVRDAEPAVQRQEEPTPGTVGPARRSLPNEGISFASVASQLDVVASGKDGAKRNWTALRGKTVTWSGTVHEVDLGRNGFKLYVRADNPTPAGRYNITVVGEGQIATARALRPGMAVRFSGTIHRADYGRGAAAVTVVLADGRIR
jgi:hypothetical protein